MKKISGLKLQHIQNTINTTEHKAIKFDLKGCIPDLYEVNEKLILKYTTYKLQFADNIIGIMPSNNYILPGLPGKIKFYILLILMTRFDEVVSSAKTYTISSKDYLLYKQDLRKEKLNKIL